MKICLSVLFGPLLAVAACAPTSAPPVAPAAPAVTPAAVSPSPPAPGASARWRADAPLRAGMARVRAATGALAHAEHGHLDRAQELALADEITAAVNAMFAQCKLAPEPDAALHPLLARLLAASQSMRERPADAKIQAELRGVLARYQALFDESAG